MKLCLLTETFYPVTGGGETQAKVLATGLAFSGADVQVITRRTDTALPRRERLGPVRLWRLPPSGPGQLKKWGMVLSAFLLLMRQARSCDAIIVCGFRILGIPALLAAKLLGKPCVLKADSMGELSGEIFKQGLRRAGLTHTSQIFRVFLGFRNRLLLSATAFVAISSAVEEELLACGVDHERISRIPNSVDTEHFSPADNALKTRLRGKFGIPAHAIVGVFTGRLVTTKGLPMLLSVWNRLASRHNDAYLLLVGDGGLSMQNCEAELREFVIRRALHQSVVFAGSVEDVRDYLRAADFFVFPSEREAFGISVIEAMACALPVITTCAGGLDDIASDEKTAVVVPVGDPEALEQAIERALCRDPRLLEIASLGRKSVTEKFAQSIVLQLYSKLLEDH